MTRIFLLFMVVVAVVTPSSDARRQHICEQRERTLADLDLAEDSLNRAKDLFPDCEDENDISNSTECGKKHKSQAFIDVALNLVSDAKNNFPVCPNVKTDVTTEVVPTPTDVITTLDCRPMDCQDLQAAGYTESGVYSVWPRSPLFRGKAVQVRCDMETDGGGWTVIQRRGNFSQQEDFNRDWEDYKNGFGNLTRDFWIGNDIIYSLGYQGRYSLRFDMESVEGDSAYEVFQEFWIEDENSNYTLHVADPKGTAGDGMTRNNGIRFSTKDRNSSTGRVCANTRKGGFWYNACGECNPNGIYNPGKESGVSFMFYKTFKEYIGLYSMEMKLKRR